MAHVGSGSDCNPTATISTRLEAHAAFAVEFFRQYPDVGTTNSNPTPVTVTAPPVAGPTVEWKTMTTAVDSPIFQRGDLFQATAGGFDPGSLVVVGTYSEFQLYGTFTADGTGTVTFDYTVPDSLGNGQHTIEAVGSDAVGNLVVAATSILVMDVGGTFTDDNTSIHESNIEGIAFVGVTRGCNPPVNDLYCPDSRVTRGQMAAFLTRALNLTDDGGGNSFTDDDGSVFEVDIAKLAAVGITRGCNPPVNDRFCPSSTVTRGQMAAFLVRALGLTDDGGGNHFVDDDGSVFENDIAALAAAGITRGCNPPANDRYCPGSRVTRAQMATFLVRALGLDPITPPK